MTRVFISYAREDREAAQRLYHDLKAANFEPWLDLVDLHPGMRWRDAITQEINSSRYFIAILSSNSVNKRGYVQKELNQALEVLEEFPAGDIFVIPVRLDECNPTHPPISQLHWVDLFPSYEDALKKILGALDKSRTIGSPRERTSTLGSMSRGSNGKLYRKKNARGGASNRTLLLSLSLLAAVIVILVLAIGYANVTAMLSTAKRRGSESPGSFSEVKQNGSAQAGANVNHRSESSTSSPERRIDGAESGPSWWEQATELEPVATEVGAPASAQIDCSGDNWEQSIDLCQERYLSEWMKHRRIMGEQGKP